MTDQFQTYITFHTKGAQSPTNADLKYYNLLKAWTVKKDHDFAMLRSHAGTTALQDPGKRDAIKARIAKDLQNAKNFLLIIEKTADTDTEWVSFEICCAVDRCRLPVIAAYIKYDYVLAPNFLSNTWPAALSERIDNKTAHVIHIPFKKEPIKTALNQFYPSNRPAGSLSHYQEDIYRKWGIIK